MREENVLVASQSEVEAVQVSASSADTVAYTSAFSSGIRQPAAASGPPSIPRLFKGSGLRRPSKIPRLARKQASIASTTGDPNAVESHASFGSKRTMATTNAPSSAVSVASAVSSRETTPFSSPLKPSRLREPKQLVGRKRPRDETGKTIASVAERLLQEEQLQQHSQDLSVATSHDDVASRDDGCDSIPNSQSMANDLEDDEPNLDQQITIARALQRDLLRDRARLRLKISALKDDVETYYATLVRMERVTAAVTAQCAETDGNTEQRDTLVSFARRIEAIISARQKETRSDGDTATMEKSTLAEVAQEEPSSRTIPSHGELPQDEEVEEH